MMGATLTVLAGLPASGKSTYARAHVGGAALLSADSIREGEAAGKVFARLHRIAAWHLASGRDVWIDACSLQVRSRQEWLVLARKAGARAVLVIIEASVAVCRARDRARAQPAGVSWGKYTTEWAALPALAAREGWARVERVRGA